MRSPTLSLIEDIRRSREQVQRNPEQRTRLQRLQEWQLQRLSRTYADFLAEPRYRPALEFFMRDLYGPHDFTQRDHELKKVLGTWERVLPERGITAIRSALELELLSQSLDIAVVDALAEREPTEMSYATAYRQASRWKDRQRQIWLIASAGRALNELVHATWVSAALRMARTPARLAGVRQLHEFLERGFRAFATMGDAEPMVSAIERRETQIMRNLFAGTPAPFDANERGSSDNKDRKPQRS